LLCFFVLGFELQLQLYVTCAKIAFVSRHFTEACRKLIGILTATTQFTNMAKTKNIHLFVGAPGAIVACLLLVLFVGASAALASSLVGERSVVQADGANTSQVWQAADANDSALAEFGLATQAADGSWQVVKNLDLFASEYAGAGENSSAQTVVASSAQQDANAAGEATADEATADAADAVDTADMNQTLSRVVAPGTSGQATYYVRNNTGRAVDYWLQLTSQVSNTALPIVVTFNVGQDSADSQNASAENPLFTGLISELCAAENSEDATAVQTLDNGESTAQDAQAAASAQSAPAYYASTMADGAYMPVTIEWEWPFESAEDVSAGDTADTALSDAQATATLTLTIHGEADEDEPSDPSAGGGESNTTPDPQPDLNNPGGTDDPGSIDKQPGGDTVAPPVADGDPSGLVQGAFQDDPTDNTTPDNPASTEGGVTSDTPSVNENGEGDTASDDSGGVVERAIKLAQTGDSVMRLVAVLCVVAVACAVAIVVVAMRGRKRREEAQTGTSEH
jgi:hypothetical protein